MHEIGAIVDFNIIIIASCRTHSFFRLRLWWPMKSSVSTFYIEGNDEIVIVTDDPN